MKVVHLSTSDSVGGAAIAARRLCDAMNCNGVDSQLLTLDSTPILYRRVKYPILSRSFAKIHKPTKAELGLFSYANLGYNITKQIAVKQADVIYIHWINTFLTLRNIEEICELGKPVILFMHDMWHITGGCHHSFDCEGYKEGCVDCPMFLGKSGLAAKQLKNKKKIFNKFNNIAIVSPSNWLSMCVTESSLFHNTNVVTIPNCLDITIFKPVDKHFARQLMNLPLDKKIICFGAHKGNINPYKGWSYLEEALQKLKDEDFAVLIFGSNYDKQIVDALPYEVYFSGYLHDEYSMVLLYNAIDLFVMPSLAEAFGQAAVEALACGAGTVGFDIGGIPDIVKHQERGYLAKYKDSEDLAMGIKYLLNNQLLSSLEWVKNYCSYKAVVDKHKNLWNDLG